MIKTKYFAVAHHFGTYANPLEGLPDRSIWPQAKESGSRGLAQENLNTPYSFSLRLSALSDLYIHPLKDLVIKILSSISNSSASIYPLYHHLSTVGLTCHFV
jgi:hypothetical protein